MDKVDWVIYLYILFHKHIDMENKFVSMIPYFMILYQQYFSLQLKVYFNNYKLQIIFPVIFIYTSFYIWE
jgi:hypothetical protein